MARFKNGVVKYFKDNIGIIIALLAMCVFLIIFPTTRSTFLTQKNIFNILRQNASNLFLATGMTMVIILGGIDPSALGALATLQQRHREDGVLIYGIDGSPDFKAMLKLGYVTGTSAQSPETIGRVAAEIAYKYLSGEEVPDYLGIEPYMITGENLDQYEVNGWQ